jgi:hypothetical protein
MVLTPLIAGVALLLTIVVLSNAITFLCFGFFLKFLGLFVLAIVLGWISFMLLEEST